MVSDRIESYINSIIKQTKKQKVKWRPFEEYFSSSVKKDEMWATLQNEFTEIIFSDSFYAQKNGETIFIITSKWMSGKDSSVSYHKEILISCSNYSDIVSLPAYADMPIDNLIGVIKEYWDNKCNDYNKEISDIFDVLDTFAEG